MRTPTVISEADFEKAAAICAKSWIEKTCPICSMPFKTTDKRTEVCGSACRQTKYFANQKLKLTELKPAVKEPEKTPVPIIEKKAEAPEPKKPVEKSAEILEAETLIKKHNQEKSEEYLQTITNAKNQLKNK